MLRNILLEVLFEPHSEAESAVEVRDVETPLQGTRFVPFLPEQSCKLGCFDRLEE